MKWAKSIWHDILEIKSTRKELREFGIVIGIFFGLIAGILIWKGKPFLVWAGLASVFFILGLVSPFVLKPFQKVWMGLAVTIGWFMSRVILGIVFFLVLTPLSVALRLTGKQFLDMDFRKDGPSHWIPKPPEDMPNERYEKQY
jgi:hypothetical protein